MILSPSEMEGISFQAVANAVKTCYKVFSNQLWLLLAAVGALQWYKMPRWCEHWQINPVMLPAQTILAPTVLNLSSFLQPLKQSGAQIQKVTQVLFIPTSSGITNLFMFHCDIMQKSKFFPSCAVYFTIPFFLTKEPLYAPHITFCPHHSVILMIASSLLGDFLK